MWLVVGLGNPGKEYTHTRHNIGFRAVELFAAKNNAVWTEDKTSRTAIATVKSGTEKIILLKPLNFMNRSGEAVQKVAHYYKIPTDHIIIIHDDLDFSLGTVKTQFDRSAAGHNGVTDIIEKLGGQEFHRIRVGIGPQEGPAENFVLQPFTAAEELVVKLKLDNALLLLQDIIK